MTFEDIYTIKRNDTLIKIGTLYGYSNPGPIFYYPKNEPIFISKDPNKIWAGDTIYIPYHPDILRKIIATSIYLIEDVIRSTQKFYQDLDLSKKEIDDYLIKIDAVNFLANIGLGIGSLVAKGANSTMTGKEALIWLFAESRPSIISNIATLSIPQPEAPKKNFKFYVRHTLGPWNPSYWATVYAACKEGDENIYLYGSDAVIFKEKERIRIQANKDIKRLQIRLTEANNMLSQSYYKKVI